MTESELFEWKEFERTGSIEAYLRIKGYRKNQWNFEAGEEFGVSKDGGDSYKNHKIR